MSNETVTISKEEHEELLSDQGFLRCLQACGVVDWSGFEAAQEMAEENQ